VKFKVLMEMTIEARTPQEAIEHAVKLKALVQNPLVKMTLAGEGVTLAGGDGQPVVFTPQPA
jgi:hypothetical protein